jgi:hypothetical protein
VRANTRVPSVRLVGTSTGMGRRSLIGGTLQPQGTERNEQAGERSRYQYSLSSRPSVRGPQFVATSSVARSGSAYNEISLPIGSVSEKSRPGRA